LTLRERAGKAKASGVAPPACGMDTLAPGMHDR